MHIVYHLGAHGTDEERLIRCLLKNRALLADQGIAVPAPTRYRRLLRDTAVQLRGAKASPESEQLILEQILEEDRPERLVLSWDSFLSFPQWALRKRLYEFAGERLLAFTRIFPSASAEFCLGLRNPATLLPVLFEKQKEPRDYAAFIGETDPESLLWSDVIARIRALNPDIPMTIWCDEDTPLIWPEVLQAVAGHAPGTPLSDTDELLSLIMSPEGFARMQARLASQPPASTAGARQLVSTFLEEFAVPEKLEMQFSLPGWDQARVSAISQSYHEDLGRIAAMPGVTLLRP